MKTIQIVVNPKGEIRLQTTGFTGPSCRDATKALEQALGLVQEDKPTAEFYQNTSTQTEARNEAGS